MTILNHLPPSYFKKWFVCLRERTVRGTLMWSYGQQEQEISTPLQDPHFTFRLKKIGDGSTFLLTISDTSHGPRIDHVTHLNAHESIDEPWREAVIFFGDILRYMRLSPDWQQAMRDFNHLIMSF